MGFNFPNTPTEGAIYIAPNGKQYVYTGGVWKAGSASTTAKTVAAISDTPPSSPVHGQLWWESDTGNLFIYYDDGDSQQWVQANLTASVDYLNSIPQDMWAGFKTGAQFTVNDKADGTGANVFTVADNGNVNAAGYIFGGANIYTPAQIIAGGATSGLARSVLTGSQIWQYSGSTYGLVSATIDGSVYTSIGPNYINVNTGGISFQTGGTTKMSLASAGSLSISPGASSGYSLTVYCQAPGAALVGFCANTSYYGISGFYSSPNYFSYYGSGQAYNSAVWTSSDGRFKTVKGAVSGVAALAAVLAVPVVSFTPNGERGAIALGADEGEEIVGMLAQDIELVVPSAVMDITPPEHDTAMREFLNKGSFKAVNDKPLIATLWAAVQELTRQVEELKAVR